LPAHSSLPVREFLAPEIQSQHLTPTLYFPGVAPCGPPSPRNEGTSLGRSFRPMDTGHGINASLRTDGISKGIKSTVIYILVLLEMSVYLLDTVDADCRIESYLTRNVVRRNNNSNVRPVRVLCGGRTTLAPRRVAWPWTRHRRRTRPHGGTTLSRDAVPLEVGPVSRGRPAACRVGSVAARRFIAPRVRTSG